MSHSSNTRVNSTFMDKLGHLINSPLLADVRFVVGSERRLMFGHKLMLATVSEAFNAMIFRENSTPVVIDDVEPDTFRELLEFIYSGQCDINKQNVTQLFYASCKYTLPELQKRCEKWLEREDDPNLILRIFNDNQGAQIPQVDEVCVNLIVQNPLPIFSDTEFEKLDPRQMRMIIDSSDNIRCSLQQLLGAIGHWSECQPDSERIECDNIMGTLEDKVKSVKVGIGNGNNYRKLQFVDKFQRTDPFFSGVLTALRPCSLFGISLFVGTTRKISGATSVSTLIRIGEKGSYLVHDIVDIPVRENEMYNFDYLFEPVKLDRDQQVELYVAVYGPNKLNSPWHGCMQRGKHDNECRDFRLVSDNNEMISPLAYLLYDVIE